ncbi:MAG TPA: hypothetical protein DCR14_16680 [Acidimicrobiaceae bacterium]|nr:hypothetical protein [Acidimicrobiaceae bacterium]
MNIVILRGQLSSAPQQRVLQSGSVLHQFEVTTRDDAGASSVPVAWFDAPSNQLFAAGDDVVVVGLVRRRFFRSGAVTQSRTEVVASVVLPASKRAKVQRVIQREVARLGDAAMGAVRCA